MILGLIQARMNSSRLPGKVLMPIRGIPMLVVMWDRVIYSRLIDHLVIATSTNKTDDPIAELCKLNRLNCFRGNLDDVLDRVHQAANLFNPVHIVRLTGDCPLIEPDIIDHTIRTHIMGGFDYTRCVEFPDGWDTEVFTREALDIAHRDAKDLYEREHVTPYFYNHPELFKLGEYKSKNNLSHLKFSVDTENDYMRIQGIVDLCLSSTLEIHRSI